jgi:hypothetical protein
MANITEPPFLLDSARVVMYAETGGRASYTGKITIHANGKWLDPVPRIAICEDLVDGDMLIFHCDDAWNVLAAGGAKSLNEAQHCRNRLFGHLIQMGDLPPAYPSRGVRIGSRT